MSLSLSLSIAPCKGLIFYFDSFIHVVHFLNTSWCLNRHFYIFLGIVEIFKYESEEETQFNELRTIEKEDGNILFCASDVAKIL